MSRGAARNKGRGGYQTPASPAAVSGPGALSARTDHQPVRPEANAGGYGDRVAAVQQQSAAPMRAGGTATPPVLNGDPAVQAEPVPTPIDPFGPSNRPHEPVTAGARLGPGPGAPGTDPTLAFLQAAYQADPYDDNVRSLIEILQERQ